MADSDELKTLIMHLFITFYPLICLLGIVGNTLSFIVFSRKKFQNTSFSVYFRFLAVTDTVAVLYSVNNFMRYRFDFGLNDNSVFLCTFYGYWCDAAGTSSAWISVMIGLDRFMNIKYPRKFPIFNRKNFQVIVCILIIITCLCSGLPEPLYVAHFVNKTQVIFIKNQTEIHYQTKCKWDDENQIYSYWFIIYEVMIPFIFMVIFSSISIKTIFDSRNRLSKKKQSNVQLSASSNKKISAVKSKDLKFALTSIALNVTFLLFVFPTNFLDILVYFISFDFDFAYVISETFYHLNFAVVFFINYFFNSIFRNEILYMIGIKSPDSLSSKSRSTNMDELL